MDFWNAFASLFSNFGNLTWQMVVMWGIGALLIYLVSSSAPAQRANVSSRRIIPTSPPRLSCITATLSAKP